MNLEKLIQMIVSARYTDRDGDNRELLYWKEQKEAVSKIIYEWGAEQLDANDINKRLGELEAKCYAYEQIIAKSNFRPFITDGRIKFDYIKK